MELRPFERTDLLRALYRLRSFPNAYLYVVRPVERGVFAHLRETEASLADYREAKASRTEIQAGFFLIYLEVVLVVLLGAVLIGMSAASSIAAPLARLVQAAGRVATGDLAVRVETSDGPEEIAGLSRAFNNMTRDLEAQQNALLSAHKEAESRRQFVETMLFGVSAGVIGLDPAGRISVVNRQAASLLELPGTRQGLPPARTGPGVPGRRAARRRDFGLPVEEDVDVVRGGESRRLRLQDRPQPGRPRADLRRHHPARRRPAQRRLEGRRAAHRPRDQEPADPDPALGRAPAAQVPQAS